MTKKQANEIEKIKNNSTMVINNEIGKKYYKLFGTPSTFFVLCDKLGLKDINIISNYQIIAKNKDFELEYVEHDIFFEIYQESNDILLQRQLNDIENQVNQIDATLSSVRYLLDETYKIMGLKNE